MTRKHWMNDLKSYRFTKCGTMTQETAKAWRDFSDWSGCSDDRAYAKALGISLEEARERIKRQEAQLAVTEIQESLF